MPEEKTKPTEVSVQSFLDKVPDESVRDYCVESQHRWFWRASLEKSQRV